MELVVNPMGSAEHTVGATALCDVSQCKYHLLQRITALLVSIHFYLIA
jgi:hypothetical protein